MAAGLLRLELLLAIDSWVARSADHAACTVGRNGFPGRNRPCPQGLRSRARNLVRPGNLPSAHPFGPLWNTRALSTQSSRQQIQPVGSGPYTLTKPEAEPAPRPQERGLFSRQCALSTKSCRHAPRQSSRAASAVRGNVQNRGEASEAKIIASASAARTIEAYPAISSQSNW